MVIGIGGGSALDLTKLAGVLASHNGKVEEYLNLTPYVMGYIRNSCEKRMKDIYDAMGFSSVSLSQEEASYRCVGELKRLVEDVNIPSTLKGFNIPEDALEGLTNDGIKQKRILARSPMPLLKEEIYKIYKSAFDGAIVEKSGR